MNKSRRKWLTNGLSRHCTEPWQDRKKEREAKKEEETQKTIEAMEAVKEGMVKVRDTAEFVKEATAKTAKSVSPSNDQSPYPAELRPDSYFDFPWIAGDVDVE